MFHVSDDGASREAVGSLAPDERFPIASVTKSLTALLVARLAVDGELQWTDPVAPVAAFATPVTWQSLLGHATGLPLELRAGHWYDSAPTRTELAAATHALPHLPLPPGTWHYSNLGYGVAAQALERLTGTAYADLLTERLLGPLGMDGTSFPDEDEEPPGVLGAAAAAGDLRSTAEDLLRLGRALGGHRPDVISWPMLALLLDGALPDGRCNLLAAGMRTCPTGAGRVLVSSGTILGHTTSVLVWPRRGVSVHVAPAGTSHDLLRDDAIARWRREDATRSWWCDGQEVVELRHHDAVELVVRETSWPVPLFAGHATGDSLTGRDWRGEPMHLTDHGDVLSGDAITLHAAADRSAHRTEENR